VIGSSRLTVTAIGSCWAGSAATARSVWSGWKAPVATAPAWPATYLTSRCGWSRLTGRTGGPDGSGAESDPIDAEAAARAVLAGTATAAPKRRDGIVEAIRVLRTARRGASKARTAASNQLKALLVTAPAPVREALDDLSVSALVTTCARFRPDEAGLADPLYASKAALQAIARRIQLLEAELELADQRLAKLVSRAAPRLLGLLAIGNDHAGQLLITAGQHPERLRGEAAFAHLCGVAPIPASSGKIRRHRLHRGGDRDANRALHLAVVVRMRFCPRTRAYVERRTKEGLSKPEIMRCIKRYLAREVYHALVADFEALHAP
jgi:transposase